MMFGGWGNQDHDESMRIVHAALDCGINFIDTADIYANGESEEIVGKALKGRRDDVVLATKFYNQLVAGPNRRGGSRRWIMTAVEDSLRRLGTDYIDLYQMHRPDQFTAIEETLAALTDLVQQGKVRYIGSSTFQPSQVVEAQVVARERNLVRFVSEQPPYSMVARGIEADLLPTAKRHGLGVIVWSPLAGGWLSGRFRKGRPFPATHRNNHDHKRFDLNDPSVAAKFAAADRLGALADEVGVHLVTLAIAWTLVHPAVTSAIIGPRTLAQLYDQLPASGYQIGDDVLDRIDQIVAPGTTVNPIDQGFSNWWLEPAHRRR